MKFSEGQARKVSGVRRLPLPHSRPPARLRPRRPLDIAFYLTDGFPSENSASATLFRLATSSIANSIDRNYSDTARLYTCIRKAERRALCVVSHGMRRRDLTVRV